jgi:hypothetical protein
MGQMSDVFSLSEWVYYRQVLNFIIVKEGLLTDSVVVLCVLTIIYMSVGDRG